MQPVGFGLARCRSRSPVKEIGMREGNTPSARRRNAQLVCLSLVCIAVGLAAGVTALTFLQSDVSEFAPETVLDLRRSGGGHEDTPRIAADMDPVLRVAIAPVVSPETSVELYGDLIRYIAARSGRRPALLRGENYSEVNDLIRMRRCDVAMVCTYSYVLVEAEYGVRLLAAPQIGGKTVYYSLILVPASSKASALSDLRNKRFASCDVLSTSGWLYPMTLLKRQGFDVDTFFGAHIISGSHDRSVFAVKSGVVDAAAVDSLVYEQMVASDPTLERQLKVIHRSPPFGMPPLVVPSDLPPELFEALQHALLNMHADAEGKGILDVLGFDRFLVVRDEVYDNVRGLHKLWQSSP